MISRILDNFITEKLNANKIIILLGPRQVGKTTMLKKVVNIKNATWINGDNIEDRQFLEYESATRFKSLFGDAEMLVIDEAQRIKNIGLNLKIIYDSLSIKIIATGSSSFDLANKVNEPLTGRKLEYYLYPLSFEELANHYGTFEEIKQLPNRLIYGSYPEVVTNSGAQKEILQSLASSYLYKDLLEWSKIKKSEKIMKLLQAIAFQVGSQVSYNELANIVGLNKETVENYIDLLEKSFVIYRLHSFNRNRRNELKKSKKLFFYDNGIRNALINNFNPIELRNDQGALWENYIITERQKFISYHNIYANKYFWRTKNQQEIDYIEEVDGQIFAYEFKWNKNAKAKFPKSFIMAYPSAITRIITPENYHEFISTLNHQP